MAATTTTKVPHLGGITAGYRLSGNTYDNTKPTTVLFNSMCTTVSLFNDMFANPELTKTMNLLAVEPLGHGSTILMEIRNSFGAQILGLMLTGTSMDCESDESRKKGAWNTDQLQLSALTEKWYSATPTPSFVIDDGWCEMVHSFGFGKRLTQEQKDFWTSTLKSVYKGDEGRKKLRVALICLIERDGLLLRLRDIKCPVCWIQVGHSGQMATYPPALASEHIKLFTSSKDVKFNVLEGGCHYLTASHPIEVGDALKELVTKYAAV
ncbi:putative alpha/beta hydrolase [Lentinula raphanica]|nr:putative alpha/beta hydrolase [Lentinula raphanica]